MTPISPFTPLGNFEIQMFDLGGSMDWDALLGDMAAGLFSTQSAGADTLRFTDGSSNTIMLKGSFGPGGGTVTSLFYFEDSVRTAKIDFSEPLAVGTGAGILPFIEQSVRADAGMVLKGGSGPGRLTGSDNDDTLDGRGGNDALRGSGGFDTISGGDGDDHLNGQQGDDALKGGAGEDVLIGGGGRNTMTGGADADAFVFEPNDANTWLRSTATDFGAGDILMFTGLTSLPGGSAFGSLGDFIAGTTLADAAAGDLASLGIAVRETRAGHAVIDIGTGLAIIRNTPLDQVVFEDIIVSSFGNEGSIARLASDTGLGFHGF